MERNIYDLDKDICSVYMSGLPAEEDLTTEYMLWNNLASQIHNENERGKVKANIKKIGPNGRTLTIGNFCCKA